MPRGGRLLDLATGNGFVIKQILSVRRDLKATGVDYSDRLPPAPRNAKLRCGIAMENLPFPSARFDAVTSQFGLEYGLMDEALAEVARVLRPGGRLATIVHLPDGPLVKHNAERAKSLAWTMDEERLLERATAAAAIGEIGTVARLIETVGNAALRQFGDGSAAAELCQAVARCLPLLNQPNSAFSRAVLVIERQAKFESNRIAALLGAANKVVSAEAMEELFSMHNFERVERVLIEAVPGHGAYAAMISAKRPM
nr:class I SAM-dependent methyltransferase [Novosphingopyxis sp. YJ-S2-01]